MYVPIKRSIERVPDGMIVPLLLGALIHTIFLDASTCVGGSGS